MAFLNYSSSVVTDSYGSLYNFLWTKDGIILTYHDKILGKSHRNVVTKDCYEEFDVIIDSKDNIHLLYQKNDRSLVLSTYTYGNWTEEIVVKGEGKKIYNMNLLVHKDKLNVIYCKADDYNKYIIYHSFKDLSGWITNDIDTISIVDILNPFEVVKDKESIILAYYDVVNNCEEIFIRRYKYENIIWEDKIRLTSSGNKKLYLDMLLENNSLHLTYCESQYGNFVVNYNKFEETENGFNKVNEEGLSNPENCSYPTFIVYDNKIWNVWTEFNRVISSYSSDRGETWEGPYLWKESVNKNFIRHKFASNDKKVKKNYNLKYSFGKPYPEITFLGFGSLNNTELLPKKKESGGNEELGNVEEINKEKYNDDYRIKGKIYRDYYEGEDNVESQNYNENIETELNKLKKQIKELNHRINYLEEIYQGNGKKDDKVNDDYSERLSKVENKVKDIEDYLVRRRRGPLFSR